MTNKFIICCDFDGVLHSYTSGWKGAAIVSDEPVPGAMAWLTGITEDGRFELAIYSARSKEPGGIEAMVTWLRTYLRKHAQVGGYGPMDASEWAERRLLKISFPTQKPHADITLDDQAICFEGVFPTSNELIGFKPWHKRTRK